MESFEPLFKAMTSGTYRLEEQEEAEVSVVRQAAQDTDGAFQPARKHRKTAEDLARRARQVTIRLASMANRCFWVSAAEFVVHIQTDGDFLQSHNNLRIFTEMLQRSMQQCKGDCNNEALEDTMPSYV